MLHNPLETLKYYLAFILSVLIFTVQAQNLTFDQLIKMQNQNLEQINEGLVNVGWVFHSSNAETTDKLGKATWKFRQSEYDPKKALAWFELNYSEGYESIIKYQVHNRVQYNLLKARINALGMKLVSSEILDEALYSVYLGKNFVVEINSSNSEGASFPSYQFTIQKKEAYLNSLSQNVFKDESDINILFYVKLIDPSSKASLWSSSNIGQADLIHEISGNSKIGVVALGKDYYQVVVDGKRGYLSKAKILRVND